MANEVIQTKVITGLQAVTVPFQTSTDTPLDVRTDQLIRHAVIGFGSHTDRLQPSLGAIAEMGLHIIVFRQADMQLRAGIEEEVELFP